MLVPQIPRNLPLFSTSICISSRANLGNQRFPVALHWSTSHSFGRWPLALAEQSKGHVAGPGVTAAPQQLHQLLLAWTVTGHCPWSCCHSQSLRPSQARRRCQEHSQLVSSHHSTIKPLRGCYRRCRGSSKPDSTPALFISCLHHSESPPPTTWLYCILINSTQEASTSPFFN